ncbi:MAG: protein kinase [Deltaproteobacteria bacterium]|nr:protein kinase [Deltaproteobacteria bacterium]
MGIVLKARLGRGRTVETYQAKLNAEGRSLEVALKKPRPELASNEEFKRAFVDWGKRHAEVEAPELVAVLEAGSSDADGSYVIQELVKGASLERVLRELRKRHRTFKVELALEIARRAAKALEALERSPHGPHGGVDPSDILISFIGDVKVGDAGLHRLDWIAGPEVKLPTTYLAPEAQADPTKSNAAADTYSLGLILLEMLIGQAIWTHENLTVEDATLALRDFSHLRGARPELTEGLVGLLERAVATDPAKRYENAGAFRENVSRLIAENIGPTDGRAVGDFVSALLPRGDDEDAPTIIAGQSSPESDASRERVQLHTVMVDSELEIKNLKARRAADPANRARLPSKAKTPAADTKVVRNVLIAFAVVAVIALALILRS